MESVLMDWKEIGKMVGAELENLTCRPLPWTGSDLEIHVQETLPSGWEVEHFDSPLVQEEDLEMFPSDLYLTTVVVDLPCQLEG